jgi:hypothetical protein
MKRGSQGTDKEKAEFESMSLEELNSQIEHFLCWARQGGSAAGRKSFFKRLVWLEKIRSEKFEIEQPRRDFRKL